MLYYGLILIIIIYDITYKKIRKGVNGRKRTFTFLQSHIKPEDKTIWFHCASLGEYEQGLPVFSELRRHYENNRL